MSRSLLLEPFRILREKAPFVEYVCRNAGLLFSPRVETLAELGQGQMRYALYDILLSLSVVALIVAYSSAFVVGVDLSSTASVFSNIQALFLGCAYYAYFSTGCFFLLILACMGIRRPAGHTRIQGALLLTLHYARCYSLFLLLIVPLLLFLVDRSLQGMLTIDEYLKDEPVHALYFLVPFLAVYLHCCLLPMKRFWAPSKSDVISFMAVFLVTQLLPLTEN
ncbi:hypothetical protein [Ectopseudomonas toyotomiensis]|uniref:hypothetical protein n=1 Tax=Ectopseudomonas toyotomiensis TaxID=554344 RepID=UPI0018C3EFE0|nr:hypothetical protein [Pseudomonas toyotomiensis]MBG0843495.1 hypothetical protein [Pseudomonas toyotomiensis]